MTRVKKTLKTLYGARHGETEENKDGHRRGEFGELTDRGKRQAEAVAKRMKNFGIEVVFAGPAKRTRDSAQYTADLMGLKPVILDILDERRRPAATHGRRATDRVVQRAHLKHDIIGSLLEQRVFADAETFRDVRSRVIEGLTLFQGYPAECMGFFGHNTYLRVMHGQLYTRGALDWMGFEDAYYTLDFNNGGISKFRYGDVWKKPDKFLWQLGFTNDISHLENLK
jgi:broad specificity phosphatase PhoE